MPAGAAEQLAFLLSSLASRAADLDPNADVDADALAAIAAEADDLADAIADSYLELARVFEHDAHAPHPFLAPAQLARARQRLVPTARQRAAKVRALLKHCLALSDALRSRQHIDRDFADAALRLALDDRDRDGGGDGDDDDDDFDHADKTFDPTWSRKQAKSRLSAEDFRKWKAQRD